MAHYSVSLTSAEAIPKEARLKLNEMAALVATEFGLDIEEEAVEPSFKVTIRQDTDPLNPRTDQDNCGVMFCRHSRYTLGDKDAKDPFQLDQVSGRGAKPDIALCLPIYMYDHSGITISHGRFSCPWDSGQVGWHYMTKETLRKDFNGDLEAAKKCLEAELEEYDHYLRGNVWHVIIENEEGDVIDGCSGFIGDDVEKCGIIGNFDAKYNDALRAAWEDRFK